MPHQLFQHDDSYSLSEETFSGGTERAHLRVASSSTQSILRGDTLELLSKNNTHDTIHSQRLLRANEVVNCRSSWNVDHQATDNYLQD